MRCCALVCRSYYSLLRGPLRIQQLVERAKQAGYVAIALADVNAMYGLVDFLTSAEKTQITPIIGVEILTDAQRVILLAENKAGYKNLCRITTARNLDPDFSLVELLKHNNKGIIALSSEPELLSQLRQILQPKALFAACPSPQQAHWAMANGFEPMACENFNIIEDSDIVKAKLLAKIRSLSTTGAGPADNVGYNKLVDEQQFQNAFKGVPKAIANNQQIFQRCSFRLMNGKYHLPKVKLPAGKSSDAELARLSHIGLAKRYRVISEEAVRRLEYELNVIKKNGFSDYFLVVKDIVDFAKSSNIPVDVRGSAAGSLVSYVLGFTRVCPLKNKLYFERFMNPGRKDCPDIDVDLCWRRRDEVIRFCYENWGYENVAMISNISRYRPKSAIRDVARALDFTPEQVNDIARRRKHISGSPVYELAQTLLDTPRHIGVHCGGIVITPEPVENLAPLEWATKGIVVTQYDKDAAEALGLIKIDLLGNRSLSTVHETVNIISKSGTAVDADQLNPCDAKTAAMLTKGDSLGVFQCESPGMRQLLQALKIRNKNDVAIALSLIRPGPAAGGMKAEFIERHVYKKPFTYLHPRMKEVLSETYGVMLYQEDVMRIAVEVAGYSIADADRFRSEVSKKVSQKKLQTQYEDFVYSRADKAGIDRQTADRIWDEILRFAAYSYCKAHATVYANIAWQTAFLKAHYPQQFYTAIFNNHHGMYPLRVYVWDAIRHGLKISPAHINRSEVEWSVRGKATIAGLNIIKGLSYNSMNQIIRERSIRPFADLSDLRVRTKLTRPELQSLIHTGACDGLGNSRPAMLMQLHFKPVEPGQLTMFELLPNPSTRQLPDYDRVTRLRAEIDTTGIPFSMHPELLVHKRHILANDLGRFINREVTVAGFLATARRAKTTDGKIMGFATLEDSSGLAEISFFPDQIHQYETLCSTSGPVWIRGKVAEHMSSVSIQCRTCGTAA